jgi:PKHD-type hydroxylase
MIARLPGLLSPTEVERVLEKLAGAEWTDGKSSAKGHARAGKRNLVVPAGDSASQLAGLAVLDHLSQSEAFRAASFPRTVLPLMFCRYDEGMSYSAHLDLPLMGSGPAAIRTDLSLTLFLSAPTSYDGGDLVIESELGEQRIRGELGEAVLYPSSTLHRVENVTRGSRLVAVTWLQSLLREPWQRRILADLARVADALGQQPDQQEHALRIRKTQYELLRMWVD